MRNLTKLTEEEIEFIIKCIETFKSFNNKDGVYDDIIEKVMDKVNIIDMKNMKKVIFTIYTNNIELHSFIIDESYEIVADEYDNYDFLGIYNDLEDKYGDALIEVNDSSFFSYDVDDMNIIN